MELLSNRVLDPFPSRIDGEINGFAWGLEVNNGGRERELLFCLGMLESVGGGRETLGRKRMGINTPSAPTVT